MSTPRKKWPHWAAWARDDAVMEATEALRDLEPILRYEGMEAAQVMRRVALVVHRLHKIVQTLTQVQGGKE